MKRLLFSILLAFSLCQAIETESGEENEERLFEGRRLKWQEEDGLQIEIINPIKAKDCKLKSRPGDVVKQFYKLDDEDGNEIGSNFDEAPWV